MELPSYSASIEIARTPDEVYALVSDITRMGEWSPVCRECWWDDGDEARVGAHFTGRNVLPERTWETRSEIVAADPGREFAWVVGAAMTRWGYTFEAIDGGTRLTESWAFQPGGVKVFAERFGDDAGAQLAERERLAHEGIPITLAAIKKSAEAG